MKNLHIVVLLVFLNISVVFAEVREFKELNFSVEVPSSDFWIELAPPMPAVKAGFKSKDNTKSIGIVLQAIPVGQKIDAQFISDFEGNSFPAGKTNKFSSEEIKFNGISARKVLGEHLHQNGISTKRGDIYFISNNLLYLITLMKVDGNPFEDNEIKSFVSSFKFLSTAPNNKIHQSGKK